MVAVTAGGWLMLGLCSQVLSSAEPAAADPRQDGQTAAAPSKEMLLYLAEFEDSQGQWIDPMSVADEAGRAALAEADEDIAADAQQTRSALPEPPR